MIKNLIDNKPTFNCISYSDDFYAEDSDACLKDSDFYPPSDDRVWESLVKDIDGGDNFADYCKYIFRLLDEEEYYD